MQEVSGCVTPHTYNCWESVLLTDWNVSCKLITFRVFLYIDISPLVYCKGGQSLLSVVKILVSNSIIQCDAQQFIVTLTAIYVLSNSQSYDIIFYQLYYFSNMTIIMNASFSSVQVIKCDEFSLSYCVFRVSDEQTIWSHSLVCIVWLLMDKRCSFMSYGVIHQYVQYGY